MAAHRLSIRPTLVRRTDRSTDRPHEERRHHVPGFEDRPSDSPFIERVWHSHSERAGSFVSVAATHCELVVTRHRGRIRVTLRGPETKPTLIRCPADGEWIGIRLAAGSFFHRYPAASLMDRQDVDLPATDRTFWLEGSAWEYPTFDNAESLVSRLAHAGMLIRDTAVAAALAGDWEALAGAPSSATFSWPRA